MSTSNKVNKIANLLLSHSLGDNGRVDKDKVSNVLEDLRKNPPLQHIEILKRFAFLVKKHMSSYQGILEYNGGNGAEMAERLCSKDFIKSNNTEIQSQESQSLIAGIRLKIGDDVYEDSLANRLNNIRKALL